jgi:hypothetical protein
MHRCPSQKAHPTLPLPPTRLVPLYSRHPNRQLQACLFLLRLPQEEGCVNPLRTIQPVLRQALLQLLDQPHDPHQRQAFRILCQTHCVLRLKAQVSHSIQSRSIFYEDPLRYATSLLLQAITPHIRLEYNWLLSLVSQRKEDLSLIRLLARLIQNLDPASTPVLDLPDIYRVLSIEPLLRTSEWYAQLALQNLSYYLQPFHTIASALSRLYERRPHLLECKALHTYWLSKCSRSWVGPEPEGVTILSQQVSQNKGILAFCLALLMGGMGVQIHVQVTHKKMSPVVKHQWSARIRPFLEPSDASAWQQSSVTQLSFLTYRLNRVQVGTFDMHQKLPISSRSLVIRDQYRNRRRGFRTPRPIFYVLSPMEVSDQE